jgi:hypothetical protein
MAWKKGESGNVLGRPPGTGEVASLRAALAQHLPLRPSMARRWFPLLSTLSHSGSSTRPEEGVLLLR